MDFKEKLNNLFDCCRFEKYAYATELHMARAIEKYYSWKYIVYGAGGNARAVVDYVIRTQGLVIEYIVDKDSSRKDVAGIPVLSREEFSVRNAKKQEKWCALVSIGNFGVSEELTDDIEEYLFSEGVLKIVKMDSQIGSMTKADWYDFFRQNRKEFCERIDIFADELSKETYYEFIRAYLEGHRYQGKTLREEDKYFLLDEGIIEHFEDEVWINLGAYNGDTIYHFIGRECGFERIYAVEGDPEMAKKLDGNLSLLPGALRDKIVIVNQYFGGEGCLSPDSFFSGQRVTYINMDIEGAEKEALLSAENIIRANRPALAICVYHKKDDLLAIPELISGIVDEYSYYLRKHPSLIGGYLDGYLEQNELVLYAVPNERLAQKNCRI